MAMKHTTGSAFFTWVSRMQRQHESLLCVGLDPQLRAVATEELVSFGRSILEATAPFACCFKYNSAFYEARGPAGIEALHRLVEHAHLLDMPVILDAKRGDIGNTAAAYAAAAFNLLGADAITLNPYLGGDSITPFSDYAGRGVFVLCHTSNPGAQELQTLSVVRRRRDRGGPGEQAEEPLYLAVAELVASWAGAEEMGLVVGATYVDAVREVRTRHPELWLLLPGIGAQGGSLEAVYAACGEQRRVIVNSSRAIITAADPTAVARETRERLNEAAAGRWRK